MSADNWAVCPRCKKRAIESRENKMLAAGKAYGSVPPKEYLDMLKAIDGPLVFPESLREDYGIGTTDSGEFYVNYRGSCENCGFEVLHKHSEQHIV